MDQAELDSHVDAIYGYAREEFTAERDRRVKELRAAGHKEEAAALKQHRKPTVPVWAINQVARREPEEIRRLIAAAENLREAQRQATSGESGTDLREASRRLRELTSELREQGREVIIESGGRPDAHLDEVAQTLFAAAVDPDQHDALRRGVFTTSLQASGFGAVEAVLAGGAATTAPGAEQDEPPPRDRAKEREAARRRELEEQEAKLRRARERLQETHDRAEARARDLQAQADGAAADAERHRTDLARLDEELQSIRDDLG